MAIINTQSTSYLIASVQRNGLLPAVQQTFEPADYLVMLNEALRSVIVPRLLSVDENYLLKQVTYPIVQSTAVTSFGGPSYPVPTDAIGMKLKNVIVVDPNGNERELPQLQLAQIASLQNSASAGFFIRDQQIFLYPPASYSPAQTLELYYFRRPLTLCDDTGALTPTGVQITGVNVSTGVITMGVTPPAFQANGTSVNFIQGSSAYSTELTTNITSYAANTITVNPSVLVDLFGNQLVNVGDWVANAGYSPFAQIPDECQDLLTQATIVKVLKALGDDRWQAAEAEYQAIANGIFKIISPRVDDSPKILTSNGRGIGDQAFVGFRGSRVV